jgi:hypothetical protein
MTFDNVGLTAAVQRSSAAGCPAFPRWVNDEPMDVLWRVVEHPTRGRL